MNDQETHRRKQTLNEASRKRTQETGECREEEKALDQDSFYCMMMLLNGSE